MVQVDRLNGLRSDIAFKAPVRVATTANITLSGLQTIDGVTVAADDRVLVKDQTDTTENGIYDVSATAWERSADFDGNLDVTDGTLVRVRQGSIAAGRTYGLVATNPVTIGTSTITFEVINMSEASSDVAAILAAADYAAVRGLLDLEVGVDVQAYNAEIAKSYTEGAAIASASTIDLDAATGNFVHITGTTTITAVTLAQGAERTVVFDGALTLTHGAGLLLGGANIVTVAGDTAVFRGEGSSVTRLVNYMRADQRAFQDASTTQKGAVEEATQAETNAGTADKFPDAASIFGMWRDSAEIAISAGGTGTVAHGHGVKPRFVIPILRCKTAEHGFSVDEEVPAPWYYVSTTRNFQASIVDATNLRYVQASGGTNVLNASGGNAVITDANWRLVLRSMA